MAEQAIFHKIHKVFNARIPVAKIFQLSTIRSLAAYIDEAVEDQYIPVEPATPKDFYPASVIQKRLYILSKLEGIDTAYTAFSFETTNKDNRILVIEISGTDAEKQDEMA